MRFIHSGWRRGGIKGTVIGLVIFFGVLFLLSGGCGPWPWGGRAIAHKMSAANCAQQLAKCYNAYCFSAGETRIITSEQAGADLTSFAVFFAQHAGMNAPDLWFMKRDVALENVNVWPLQVADLSDPKHAVVDPVFAKARPKSFAVVVNLPDPKTLEAHATTYPVVWTRGLGEKGWKKNSPWNGEGGHVAYLDGHTAWYESTVNDDGVGIFKDYLTGQPTSDIRKAIGPGAKVLEDE